MRLIDADALIALIEKRLINTAIIGWLCRIISEVPTIEVEPVQHGRWVMTLYATTSKRNRVIANKKFACSECGYSNGRKQSNYCPNCGANMRGDADE